MPPPPYNMLLYQIYDLRLQSPRELAHLAAAPPDNEGPPDIELFLRPDVNPATIGAGLPWQVFRQQIGSDWFLIFSAASAGGDVFLRLHTRRGLNETAVLISRATGHIELAWRAAPSDSEGLWHDLSGWLLGSVMGYLMSLHGLPTLHASVVAVGCRAINRLFPSLRCVISMFWISSASPM